MDHAVDAVDLAQALIRCPSVTPEDHGALDRLELVLAQLGFRCFRMTFEEEGTPPVDNLYARLGEGGPHLGFAGHTDVVPAGRRGDWSHAPFEAAIADGQLYGRGAVDMKGAIAAFVSGVARQIELHGKPKGSISLLMTGDEEGPGINGTKKLLAWMRENGHVLDHCIVGEPTSQMRLGDTVKIGRRGSLLCTLTVEGRQGHVAYPQNAKNPIHCLARLMTELTSWQLDRGTPHFEPSTLQFTKVTVDNDAENVIPGMATANFAIRFNPLHTGESLEADIRARCDELTARTDSRYRLDTRLSGEAFLTEPGRLTELVAASIAEVTGRNPALTTGGGTSDARFIKDMCPVIECGLVGRTMHAVDEHVAVEDIHRLAGIYRHIIAAYFAGLS